MQSLKRKLLAMLALTVLPIAALAAQQPVRVVVAENFYGDIAEQIGSSRIQVTSILSNPDQEPHLFEVSVSTARALSRAQIMVYNSVGYNPWMEKLLTASVSPGRLATVAGRLLHKKDGDNPDLRYDPETMPSVAKAIAAALENWIPPAGLSINRA